MVPTQAVVGEREVTADRIPDSACLGALCGPCAVVKMAEAVAAHMDGEPFWPTAIQAALQ